MGRRSYEIVGPHWAAADGPIATAKPNGTVLTRVVVLETGVEDILVLADDPDDLAPPPATH